MGYSVRDCTFNAADLLDDDISLLKFAYKRTRTYYYQTQQPSDLERLLVKITTPFVFLKYLIGAPFLFKVDDKYVCGTPEYKERVSKIKVRPLERFGVIADYNDC